MALAFGIFGLIIGSFLNVVVLRWGKKGEESFWRGRSRCPACRERIAWYDNIPLVSWLLLRGRCRRCGARISLQYALVEAGTGALFALIGGSGLPLVAALYACILASFLILIAVHDLRTTFIPDAWSYSFAALALVSQVLFALPAFGFASFLGGPIAALPLFLLWAVSRGRWMGFGDVKLALGMGWLLGTVYGVAAVFFAFILGAAVSVGILLPLPRILRAFRAIGITSIASKEGFTIRSEIPFGPFLVASTLVIWLLLIYQVDPLAIVGLGNAVSSAGTQVLLS